MFTARGWNGYGFEVTRTCGGVNGQARPSPVGWLN